MELPCSSGLVAKAPTAPKPTRSGSSPTERGPTAGYAITNVNAPSEAWNVVNNGTASGSLIQLWTYAGNPNEEWMAVSLGNGSYKFVGQGSGLCLDVPGASTANGVQLQIYTCNGTAAQAFKLVVP